MTEVSHQGKEDASIRHDAVTRESFLCDRARFPPASAANYSRARTTQAVYIVMTPQNHHANERNERNNS